MKTVERKAKEYSEPIIYSYSDCRWCDAGELEEYIQDAYIAGYTEANKWISVEEELPPCSYKDILVKGYDIDGNVSYGIAYMHDTNTGIPDKNNFIVSEYINIVTHWRPIN